MGDELQEEPGDHQSHVPRDMIDLMQIIRNMLQGDAHHSKSAKRLII